MKYYKRAQPRAEEDLSKVQSFVGEVLERIRKEGERAVRHYSETLDKWNPKSLYLTKSEIADAEEKVSPELKQDILFLRDQVTGFAEAQKRTLVDFETETKRGVVLGQKYIPVESVGVYVPGGRYTLIASAIMSIVPARVAGVERIVACTPPKDGKVNPAVIYAIHQAGADQIFTIGGAQAIGAMSFGMGELMKPVDMIAGPGNKYVVEAKRQVFGRVGIDLLAGPTEIGVIADDGADPELVAADVLAQAEHDPDSPQFVVTLSEKFAQEVYRQIEEQLLTLPTADVAGAAWKKNGEIVIASSREEAAEFSDERAPEHLEVHSRSLDWYLRRLKNYGSLFLGEDSTVAYSDKAIGTNHILPTGRAARYTGGLWVGKYMKNVTYQRLDAEGSLWIAPHAARIAHAEGMLGHERSATIRMEKYGSSRR